MKKLVTFFSIIMLLSIIISCQKEEGSTPKKQYLECLEKGASVNISKKDMKKAGYQLSSYTYYLYIKQDDKYVLVNKDMFIPNSNGYNYWATPGNNPRNILSNFSPLNINYWPKAKTRLVLFAIYWNDENKWTEYFGIYDCDVPGGDVVSIPIKICETREYLAVNNHLISRPECYGMKLTVSYTVSHIDKLLTGVTSQTTDNFWPQYVYNGSHKVVDRVVEGAGDFVVENYAAEKITGDISISLSLNGKTQTITTPASEPGVGLIIDVDSDKLSFSGYGAVDISATPIKLTRRTINF